MQITEPELRALIRDAIARHTAGGSVRPSLQAAPAPAPAARVDSGLQIHASHSLFLVAGPPDGECVIEAGHRCDHCGYCKSLGH